MRLSPCRIGTVSGAGAALDAGAPGVLAVAVVVAAAADLVAGPGESSDVAQPAITTAAARTTAPKIRCTH